ncbi:winged helix-turn-helix transcriptional regulator [Vallitaleaceae bacterium 9-2]
MDKELILLNIIESDGNVNQRVLAKALDVSLGTVNHMLQEYEEENIMTPIRKKNRKVEYLLTDYGKEYHNKLLVDYISSCFEAIAHIRKKVKEQIYLLLDQGIRQFFIQGNTDEISRVVKMCLIEISREQTISYELIKEEQAFDEMLQSMKADEKTCSAVIGWSVFPNQDYNEVLYKNLLS